MTLSARSVLAAPVVWTVFAVLAGVFGMHALPGHDAAIAVSHAGHAATSATAHSGHTPASGSEDHHEICVARPANFAEVASGQPIVVASYPLAAPVAFAAVAGVTRAHDVGRSPPCLHKLSVLRI